MRPDYSNYLDKLIANSIEIKGEIRGLRYELQEIYGKLDTLVDVQKENLYHSANSGNNLGCIPLEIMKQSFQQVIRDMRE